MPFLDLKKIFKKKDDISIVFKKKMPDEVTQCRQKRKRDDDTLLSRICVAKEVCDILIVCVKDSSNIKLI